MERVLRNALHPASILDFRPRLGNRCKLFPVYTLFRASILDFKPKLGNRCTIFPVYPVSVSAIMYRDLIVKRTAGQFPAVLILLDAIEALD